MEVCDIGAWVAQETNPRQKDFRAAVHTVLHAIANSPLRVRLIVKGGILLAFRYQSRRHTRDLDFSTDAPYAGFDAERFRAELEAALACRALLI
ncbi:MAG: nucleotidyl transferase AbiEii/AbiGii toxin family protein [Thermodesulfobacteriota bacterium]